MARRHGADRAGMARRLPCRRCRAAVAGSARFGRTRAASRTGVHGTSCDKDRALAILCSDNLRHQPRSGAGRPDRRVGAGRRVDHAARSRCHGAALAGGRSVLLDEADGRAIARRGRRVGSAEFLLVRPCRKHRRNDPGGRVHRRRSRRSMMVIDQRYDSSERFRLGLLADKANHLIQRAALPSLVQLVMRVALAVPFWRSGILKWDGLLKLSDTAVTLFTDEFTLHLPGGPYHYPAPTVMAFLSGCGEILFPVLLVLGLATRFAALGLLFMTVVVELTVPDGWPVHITWAAMALSIMAWGPGRTSIDHWLHTKIFGNGSS